MNQSTLRAPTRAAGLVWLAVAAAVARPGIATAQQDTGLVEGVVAVVGDTAIMWTELQEYIIEARAQGVQVPRDPEQLESFLAEALDRKVNEVVVYLNARRAGITVSDRDVNQYVEERLAQVRRNFPTEADFQQALLAMGTTSAEYRIRVTQRTRVELVSQQFLQQEFSQMTPIPVSEADETGHRRPEAGPDSAKGIGRSGTAGARAGRAGAIAAAGG
jgi:hypothetical protein